MKKLLLVFTMIMASVYLLGQSWDHTYTYLPADSITGKDTIQILVIGADPAGDTTFTMLVSDLDALWEGELNNEAGLYSALSDVTQFLEATDSPTLLDGTANTVLYIDGSGDVTELALGASGTYLESQGDGSAPQWSTPSGSGDVSKVGTPVDNQVGVWTGDGTLEGDADLTFDGSDLTTTGVVTSTGFTIGSAVITEAELEVIDGATLTTTELNYVDGVTSSIQTQIDAKLNTADTLDANTQVWMLEDTISLGSSGLIDSLNTTWCYMLLNNAHGSDTLTVTHATQMCDGTTVDFTIDIMKNDTINGVANDTIVSSWQITDESGDIEDASSVSNTDILPGEVVWFKASAVTTEPSFAYITLFGYRKNAAY